MKIEIDIKYDHDHALRDAWLDRHPGCYLEGYVEDGPAGGNPMVTVRGIRRDLKCLLSDDWLRANGVSGLELL